MVEGLNLLKKIKRLARNPYIYMTVIFLFFFYLAFNTPLTGDDWTWGTDRGLLRLRNFFDGYNGRYISNILEIILTRSDLLRYFVVALFSTALIYLIGRLYSQKEGLLYSLLGLILLLLMPTNIFSQTFGWTAGFVNYVVSLVFLLAYLVITKNIYDSSRPSYPRWLWILMIPLGITTQLLVEHVSLFAMIVGLYVIVYSYIKYKKLFKEHIVYFVSLLIGSIVMFTNKAYINVLTGNDGYRTVKETGTVEEIGLISKVYNAYAGKMHEYIFLESSLINIFIGIMIVILILNSSTGSKFIKTVTKPLLLLNTIGPILFLLSVRSTLGDNYFGNKTNDFEVIISLLFYVAVFISIIIFVRKRDIVIRLLLYYSGVVLLTAPFVFITPYGPRAALATYLFLVLIGIELFQYNKSNLQWSSSVVKRVLIYTTIILFLFYSIVFTRIGMTNRDRLIHLKSEAESGAEKIELSELPHSQFLWMSSTKRKHFQEMFKRYYDVPEDVEIEFVPYYKSK